MCHEQKVIAGERASLCAHRCYRRKGWPSSTNAAWQPGVKMVDLLEGPPDVIVMLQARSRLELAELTNQALVSVESMTEDLKVLPVQNR